jgi:hypothetical protein
LDVRSHFSEHVCGRSEMPTAYKAIQPRQARQD